MNDIFVKQKIVYIYYTYIAFVRVFKLPLESILPRAKVSSSSPDSAFILKYTMLNATKSHFVVIYYCKGLLDNFKRI